MRLSVALWSMKMMIEPFVLSHVEACTAQNDSPFDKLRVSGGTPILGGMRFA